MITLIFGLILGYVMNDLIRSKLMKVYKKEMPSQHAKLEASEGTFEVWMKQNIRGKF